MMTLLQNLWHLKGLQPEIHPHIQVFALITLASNREVIEWKSANCHNKLMHEKKNRLGKLFFALKR